MSFSTAPVITTSRLVLRSHRLADFEPLHAMWSDPAVYEFITGRPATREESWARLLRYLGHWQLLGFGNWAVEERATGGFVGEMGFADYHRDMKPSLKDTPEQGWVLSPQVHRRGYAMEALSAICDWGDRNLKGKKTACIISPDNLASMRVAQKLGFVEHRRTSYQGAETVLHFRKPGARG